MDFADYRISDSEEDICLESEHKGYFRPPSKRIKRGLARAQEQAGKEIDRKPFEAGEEMDRKPFKAGEEMDQKPSEGGEEADQKRSEKGKKAYQNPSEAGEKEDQKPSEEGEEVDQKPSEAGEETDQKPFEAGDDCSWKQEMERALHDILKKQVLRFLPAKALCRFRSVSKEWDQWIKSAFLAHLQSYSFSEISGLFCQIPHKSPFFISFNHFACGVPSPFLGFLPEEVTVRATCNGLLCCKSRFAFDTTYYICNPANKEWMLLPKPRLYHGPNSAVALNFEPGVFNFKAHFELICAVRSSFSDLPVVFFEIYSSRSNSWRVAESECWEPDALVLKGDGFVSNGVALWETSHGSVLALHLKYELYGTLPPPQRNQSQGVLAIGLNDERCGTIPLPERNGSKGALTAMHGELCYILPRREENQVAMEVYGDLKMCLKYTIPFSPEACSEVDGDLRALGCMNDDLLMLLAGNKVCTYHVKEGKLEILSNILTCNPQEVRFLPYVNSLVPVGEQLLGNDEDFYYNELPQL